MTTRTFPAALVDTLARCAHEANYLTRGERYADPAEMDMHRADPCACWEMVSAQVVAALGLDPAAYGPKDAWRDGDQFVFQNWSDRMEADAEEVAETAREEADIAWRAEPLAPTQAERDAAYNWDPAWGDQPFDQHVRDHLKTDDAAVRACTEALAAERAFYADVEAGLIDADGLPVR